MARAELPKHLYIQQWPNGALSVHFEPRIGAVEYIAEECVEMCAHCENIRRKAHRAAGGDAIGPGFEKGK